MSEIGCPIRTDLAVETQESLKKANSDMRGVKYSEKKLENGIVVSVVTIDTENAVKATGRPKGRYVTLEAGQINEEDEECLARAAKELSRVLREFVKSVCDKKIYHALVVGLGNRNVTPDALGPRTVDNLFITRHIVKEYGRYAFGNENVNSVCGLVPGVMAQTGMECLEIIKGVVKETKPDFVVTIDALAARSTKRLGCTIQLTDTGIVPGSGVGNHREGINRENLGVPVISIGIPTVIDAVTIVSDAVNASRDNTKKMLSPKLNGMFVTPKDIDEKVKKLSGLISEGINMAFSNDEYGDE